VLDRAFGHPLELEENAALSLAGGMLQQGHQCGLIWGAALAAGAEAFRRFGSGPEAEVATIRASQRVVESFRTRHDEINCAGITQLHSSSSSWDQVKYFLIKGGTIGCARMAGWYAPLALDEINAAFSEQPEDVPEQPMSCAAQMARKMGDSDMHAVMASGFAGGVGLCGGACGALGAAIWMLGMKIASEEGAKVGFKDPRTQELFDRFMKHTDSKLECSEIVGRTFSDADDHAEYLRGGGCSELMEMLAGG
jgi:hypothetical protein